MTPSILLSLVLLLAVILVLASGRMRLDVVALLTLVLVAILGLSSPQRAVAGFSSPAVLTIAGMFVLSAGLSRTGVAALLGQWMLRMAGRGEARVVMAICLVSGGLSGLMNNVGVVAMMLPVVAMLSRRTAIPPSKLMIPMAMGAQLGGFITLIGAPPNLIVSEALREAGYPALNLFAFAPLGLILLAVGTVLMVLAAPRLLPTRVPGEGGSEIDRSGIRRELRWSEGLFYLTLPQGSLLDGKTLGESLIDSALGIHVLAIEREGRTVRAPGPETGLRAGDRVLVQGDPQTFLELRGREHLSEDGGIVSPEWLESSEVGLCRALISPASPWVGRSAAELQIRAREGVLLLALHRGEDFRRRSHFLDTPLRAGDVLLLQGKRDRLVQLAPGGAVEAVELLSPAEAVEEFALQDRLWSVGVRENSLLDGRRLGDTRLGDAVGFQVLAVGRRGEGGAGGEEVTLLPGPGFTFHPGDRLLVKGRPEDMIVLRGLQELEVDLERQVDPTILEGEEAGFVEVVLAPRSSLIGKTLRQVGFRGRFGMQVVAILREGGMLRADLRSELLRFGDALLLYGPRRSRRALGREADLILLSGGGGDEPDVRLAPRSIVVTGLALLPVILGWLPISIGVLLGAVLMVLTRCLAPEDAYRAIEWPTLVLVAGMLSLGGALGDTGAGALLGERLMQFGGGWGPHALLALLVLLAALGGQILPGSAVAVLLAPIGISSATHFGVSPVPYVIAIAVAATSLASPVSQPSQALIMGPAGYRMGDYLRLGVPLTAVVLLLTILLAPLLFPF